MPNVCGMGVRTGCAGRGRTWARAATPQLSAPASLIHRQSETVSPTSRGHPFLRKPFHDSVRAICNDEAKFNASARLETGGVRFSLASFTGTKRGFSGLAGASGASSLPRGSRPSSRAAKAEWVSAAFACRVG